MKSVTMRLVGRLLFLLEILHNLCMVVLTRLPDKLHPTVPHNVEMLHNALVDGAGTQTATY